MVICMTVISCGVAIIENKIYLLDYLDVNKHSSLLSSTLKIYNTELI